MKKRKITERLHLLNGGREAYLNFLRNLTPQIAILSVAIVAGLKLDFTRFDLGNSVLTFLFFILVGSFLLAAYINITVFKDSFTGQKDWLMALDETLAAQNLKRYSRIIRKMKICWSERLVELLEILVVVYAIPFILSLVMVMSTYSALSILRLTHNAS